jgi:hypothetical protein
MTINLSTAYLAWEQPTLQKGRQEAEREILLEQLTQVGHSGNLLFFSDSPGQAAR